MIVTVLASHFAQVGLMAKNIPGTPVFPPDRGPGCRGTDNNRPAPFLHPLPPEAPGGRVHRGILNIRIDRDGVWYYEGSPINRKSLVCLFASVLTRDASGAYWLITPVEMGRIDVEDAPFIALELFTAGSGRDQILSVRTNVDEIVTIDNDHPVTVATNRNSGEPSPYVTLRPGIEARLSRSVYYQLVDLGVEADREGAHMFGVWSSGCFFPLGSTEM
jgi:uncharacterized protein